MEKRALMTDKHVSPKWTLIIMYKNKIIFETHDLKSKPRDQDAIDQVVKLAKWNKKEKGFHKEGHYVIDYGGGAPELLIDVIGDTVTFCEINHSETLHPYNGWQQRKND